MDRFPDFMKNSAGAIDPRSQSKGVTGCIFDGVSGFGILKPNRK